MKTMSAFRRVARRLATADNRRPARGTRARFRVEALDPRVLLSGMDHAMHPEHAAALKLVPHEEASHVAVSGNWSDIWGQAPPSDGAQVLIPEGVTVTVDGRFDEELEWIRVDGDLQFATDVDTALRVETIVVSPPGRLRIGTAEDPIAADVGASITFVDQGPIDRIEDPLGVGRGLIDLGGHLSIYGAETTGFVDLAEYPMAGDTVLHLAEVPADWEVGGQVVVAGTNPILRDKHFVQDEVRMIVAIDGASITLDRALEYDHDVAGGVPLPLAYMDRNVVLTSENTADPSRRGHIMIMAHDHDGQGGYGHQMGPVIAYARLDGLGRTRADMLVTDPQLDGDGNLIVETTGNDRGRYTLHFHRMGIDADAPTATVRGVSIQDGLKWGVAVHETRAVVEDSVSFDVDGAAFATEFGNEVGAFRRNLAIRSYGDRDLRPGGFNARDLSLRGDEPLAGGEDLGWQGYGFWLQGGGVEVTDNIAIGHKVEGFAIFTQPQSPGVEFPVENLPEDVREVLAVGPDGEPRTHAPIDEVPFTFARNVGIASRNGVGVYFHQIHEEDRRGLFSRVDDSTFANVDHGIKTYHASNIVIEDARFLNDNSDKPSANSGNTLYGGTSNLVFRNPTIVGFGRGIGVPGLGRNVIEGGYFRNTTNIEIGSTGVGEVVLDLEDADFGPPGKVPRFATYKDVAVEANSRPSGDISELFRRSPRTVTINLGGRTYYLYPREADPSYRFDTADSILPDSIHGMTAQELWDAHHAAIGGDLAGPDAFEVPGIDGVLSAVAPPELPHLRLTSGRFTNQVEGHVVEVFDEDRFEKHRVATVDLEPDAWNFVTFEYEGHTFTELVYCDVTPRSFQQTDSDWRMLDGPLTITRDDLESGFTVYGLFTDTVGKVTTTIRGSRRIDPADLTVGDDGRVRATIAVEDEAGNVSLVELTFLLA